MRKLDDYRYLRKENVGGEDSLLNCSYLGVLGMRKGDGGAVGGEGFGSVRNSEIIF